MFTLTRWDVKATPTIVTCIMILFGKPIHILIDLVSTHSFVFLIYSIHANVPRESMGYGMPIASPTGEDMIVDEICCSCAL